MNLAQHHQILKITEKKAFSLKTATCASDDHNELNCYHVSSRPGRKIVAVSVFFFSFNVLESWQITMWKIISILMRVIN